MISLAYSNSKTSPAPSTAPKVLIVDDELPVLLTLKRAMRRKFQIEVAMNAQKALELLSDHNDFAVILSDMHMPGMDGLEFLKRAQKISPNTSRIMLTGAADFDVALQALNDCQVFRFLQKPCSADHIAGAILEGAKAFDRNEAPDRAASTILSNFQEELRTPLSQMVTFAKLIKNDQSVNGLPKEYATQIIENGQAVLNNSETILDMVAMQTQNYKTDLSEFDAQTLIRHAAQPDKKLALAKGLRVNLDAPPEHIQMKSDERLLRRALRELISNAIKFSHIDSQIDINLSLSGEDNSHIVFEITDYGCGMDTTHITSSLYALNYSRAASESKQFGSGMGLPLAYATAETLDGYLEIISEADEGATVRLFVPLNAERITSIPL